MQKWEYLLLIRKRKGNGYIWEDQPNLNQSLVERLNELGAQGWEVLGFSQAFTEFGAISEREFLLKRPTD